MAKKFYINDSSNPKVKAFLTYIKSLDFVRTEEDKDFVVSENHLKILNDRRNDRLEGNTKSYSWEEVKKSAQLKIYNT